MAHEHAAGPQTRTTARPSDGDRSTAAARRGGEERRPAGATLRAAGGGLLAAGVAGARMVAGAWWPPTCSRQGRLPRAARTRTSRSRSWPPSWGLPWRRGWRWASCSPSWRISRGRRGCLLPTDGGAGRPRVQPPGAAVLVGAASVGALPREPPPRGDTGPGARDAAGRPPAAFSPHGAPRERPDRRFTPKDGPHSVVPHLAGTPAFAPSTSVDGGRGSAGGAPDATGPSGRARPELGPAATSGTATALDPAGDDPAPGGRACRGRRPPGRHALEHRARPPRSRRLRRGGGRRSGRGGTPPTGGVIGPDADALLPGQVLRPPASAPEWPRRRRRRPTPDERPGAPPESLGTETRPQEAPMTTRPLSPIRVLPIPRQRPPRVSGADLVHRARTAPVRGTSRTPFAVDFASGQR